MLFAISRSSISGALAFEWLHIVDICAEAEAELEPEPEPEPEAEPT